MTEPATNPSNRDAAESWVDEIVHNNRESLARQRAADAPKKIRSWLPVLIPIAVVCIGLTVWNPGRRVTTSPKLGPVEQAAVNALGVEIAIGIVEAYRDSVGRLPETLAEATAIPLGVEYRISTNGTYSITSGKVGKRTQYRSNGPHPDLGQAFGPVLVMTPPASPATGESRERGDSSK